VKNNDVVPVEVLSQQMREMAQSLYRPKIKTVLILAAGQGTRLGRITDKLAKPLLDINGMTTIAWIVLDGLNAGITNFVIVITKDQKAVIDDLSPKKAEKARILNSKRANYLMHYLRIWQEAKISFVYQDETHGKGDLAAVAAAYSDIYRETFILAFGDGIFEKNAIQQAVDAYNTHQKPVVVLSTVDPKDAPSFGVAVYTPIDEQGTVLVNDLAEKRQNPPSLEAMVGVYAVTQEELRLLTYVTPGDDGEIRMTDLMKAYIRFGGELIGIILDGWWGDTGTIDALTETRVLHALTHPTSSAKTEAMLAKRGFTKSV